MMADMEFVRSHEVDAIKARIDHPIIDADGHCVEFVPIVADILSEIGGPDMGKRFRLQSTAHDPSTPAQRREQGRARHGWWAAPAVNTLDRATAMLPALLAKRLPELGLDHAVVYGTLCLGVAHYVEEDYRRATARAFNTYFAESFRDHRDVITAVGAIPMFTPEEAIDELEYATGVLGLEAFVFGAPVPRPHPLGGTWIDSLCVDSVHDYDPVWAKCVELGVAPTFHTQSAGWGSRTSPSSYVFNHIGMFATGGEAMARAMFLGGVPHRFPELRCAFQEGGVAWAANLYSDLVGHWEKRNRDAIGHYDPARIDKAAMRRLAEEFGGKRVHDHLDDLDEALRFLSVPEDELVDEFAASGVETKDDIRRLFTERFYFGCEADDPLTALAFDSKRLPMGARLQPLFASDIGHWDVPDAREVLPEAWECVEKGLASEEDFRQFTYGNVVELWPFLADRVPHT